MNAVTPIRRRSSDTDLTAIFEREGIKKIERLSCFYTVVLFDGRIGVARSIGDALAKATAPGALNVMKVRAA